MKFLITSPQHTIQTVIELPSDVDATSIKRSLDETSFQKMASSCHPVIKKSGIKYTATTALNPTKVILGFYVISFASDGKEIFKGIIPLKMNIPVKCHDITNQETTHKNSETFKISPYHKHSFVLLYQ